ncbi:related to arabinan endo-1,5-alpha-L-arabinosidase A precursor [Armillaria ostoyae]|uniref:Endo-1,5-alpha-L-arabinanase A n=1 Tax=Armillaria ostoyae TaxID=47428 RepID=A0A284REZ1_ARMOS|nr:related to arabinan endo-1,5-alpha-L-arabinosidase A precursor [Armillaria ostoyae]
MHLFLLAPLLLWFLGITRAQVGPGVVTGNTAVHDPTICKDSSGKYFVFSTGVGLEIRTSPDRVAFTFVGLVWPNGASWTDPFTLTSNGHCTLGPGLLLREWRFPCNFTTPRRLPDLKTYGISLSLRILTSATFKSAIFYATSSTGLPGSFTNHGLVTSTSSSNNYNAIDPNLLVDGSNWYLSLGSFWTGIKVESVSPSTGLSTSSVTSIAQRTANGGAIEASVIYKHGSFYYLFTSWDLCCQGTSSTYNIRVGRSTSPTSGFVDQAGVALTSGGGTLVLGTHGSIVGPGGQDLMDDVDGSILVYHYYTSSGSFLGINRLDFSSGWPVVV